MTVPPIITILKPELARDTLKEPPKRWFNWYRSAIGWFDTEEEIAPGDVPWPSRDVAEAKAAECIALHENEGRHVVDIGAFPEGERP